MAACSNNVMDVAWSPDDSMVATCSLDNSVMVWSAAGKQVQQPISSNWQSFAPG